MKVMIAGLPGSGKTTQAKRLAEDLDLEFVSMGDVLREVAKGDSELGREIKAAISQGDLVDEEKAAALIKAKVESLTEGKGIVIDGYPRSTRQIDYFDPKYDLVVYLKVSPQVGLQRLLLRHREDDIESVIKRRLEVQEEKLKELLVFLESNYRFVEVDGEKEIEQIHQEIMGRVSDVS